MPQSISQGSGWDLLAIIPGVLAAASLISLLFIWIRESLRHFANDPREYFLAAFWSFTIVGTGLALFGVTAKTALTVGAIAAAVIFIWEFFAASL